jgi:hypothetical protein
MRHLATTSIDIVAGFGWRRVGKKRLHDQIHSLVTRIAPIGNANVAYFFAIFFLANVDLTHKTPRIR